MKTDYFGKAKSAGATNQIATEKEQVGMAVNELITDYYQAKYISTSSSSSSIGTQGQYVWDNLKQKLQDKYSEYASVDKPDGETTEKIILATTDEEGNQVTGVYNTTTGEIKWSDEQDS